ncbi:hypothetical protein METP3_00828 [Methanosarcinales archaeon]|nr:hypothetical protein METP3_00828 [Methanosarcinales archaeon]
MNRILGHISYENWNAAQTKKDSQGGYEVPLFTDAHVTGEFLKSGPYQFLNTVAIPGLSGSITPSVILRVENYLEISPPSHEEMDHTDDTYYHGGLLHNEIAGLASLIFGVRFKSGGITRIFEINKDSRGKPVHYEIDKNPILLKGKKKLIIPNACRTIRLNDLDQLLRSFPTLTPEDAIILVKASRLYQDALWIAESEPELAWIMFVSAIETAANHWNKSKATPVEKLNTKNPKLVDILNEKGGITLVEEVANFVAPYMGATKKFIDFVLEFLPPEPKNRPAEWARHSWEKNKIKKTLDIIYDYRSKALHEGKPFPAPMCMVAPVFGGNISEIPFGYKLSLATAKGGKWVPEDIPIILHTFEYIVRGVLLRWWTESLIPKK